MPFYVLPFHTYFVKIYLVYIPLQICICTIVAWDGDFRFDGTKWTYNNFVGTRWQKINSDDKKLYLKNAYRVLLTRARQGMAIYVPEGDVMDDTRPPEYYDKTYEYLQSIME